MGNFKKQLVAAYGFIRNTEGKFLLVRRAKHDTHPGMWELPGGAVEPGEDPKDATIREVLEESGLNVTVVKPLATVKGKSRNGHNVVRHGFLCEIVDTTENVVLSEEHSAYQWVSLEKIPDLHLSRLVEHIFEKKKTLGL